MSYKILEGDYAKLGIQIKKDGVIFTFEGEREDDCAVLLHDSNTKKDTIVPVPKEYCMGALRSVFIQGIDKAKEGYLYIRNGETFMDPYAYAVMGRDIYHDTSRKASNYQVYGRLTMPPLPKTPIHGLEIPKAEMFMYKLHVRGFTKDKGAKGKACGTFAGVMNKIPYLKSLGVTTVELMPCYEYEEFQLSKLPENPYERKHKNELLCKKQINYWGYTGGQYFAVKASYAMHPDKAGMEFLKLVNKLHEAGMECIMEMYFPEETNQNLILEALQFWVRYYHVDGFHLLGSNVPILTILQNSFLARTKIFYEHFPEEAFGADRKYKRLYVDKEEYLYPARMMLNHINGNMQSFADQQKKQGNDHGYINYLASNNGFTFMDCLMYNDHHNETNGEDNFDGPYNNYSHNYGVEGPSRKKMVCAHRKRQWKNGMAMLFLAQGVPMLMAGDEFCNSKQGNNNSYCQDNEIGWVNWKNLRSHSEEVEFVRFLSKLRRKNPILSKEHPFTFSDSKSAGVPDLSYHGSNAWITGIAPDMMAMGMLYCGSYSENEKYKTDVYVAYNFLSREAELAIPKTQTLGWKVAMSTGEVDFKEEDRLLQLDGHCICILTKEEA